MTSRRCEGPEEPEGGFTLVELLVVMVVIGVLAAIAIPAFVSQRQRAHDASTRADVSAVGKEVASYFVDGPTTVSLDMTSTPGQLIVSDGSQSSVVNLTNGTAAPTAGAFAGLDDPEGWCVALTDPKGFVKEFRVSAGDGLEEGTC